VRCGRGALAGAAGSAGMANGYGAAQMKLDLINAAIVEGDSFHRYDREQMKVATADADKEGNHHFCHFSPEANLLEELETLFREYGENGRGKVRKYLHDPQEAKPYGQLSRSSTWSGFRSCTGTRQPAATPAKTWSTRFCGACRTTSTTSVRSSPART
jgi:phosphoribulokinase